jgi:predicted Zn-dependent protease with MMP-like domain
VFDESSDQIDFELEVENALASLPQELRDVISNVAIVVEAEPPPGQPLLGLYQ